MASSEDPEQVGTFCEIAQADRETAIRLLNSCDWNLERALQLHFEGANPTIPPEPAASTPAPASTTTAGAANSNAPISSSQPLAPPLLSVGQPGAAAADQGWAQTPEQQIANRGPVCFSFLGEGGLMGFVRGGMKMLTQASQVIIGIGSEDYGEWFSDNYGPGLAFHQGSFIDACKTARNQNKMLLVVFHIGAHSEMDRFYNTVMKNIEFQVFVSSRFLLWAGDTDRFEPSSMSQMLTNTSPPNIPMVLIKPTDNLMGLEWPMGNFFQKIVEVQFGTEVADATQILMVVSEEIEQVNQARATAANAQQVQRETDRLIRQQQDEEYEAALLEDQMRQVQIRENEDRVAKEAADRAERENREAEEHAQALERVKKELSDRKDAFEASHPDRIPEKGKTARLALRLPDGKRLNRNFLADEKFAAVFEWATVHGVMEVVEDAFLPPVVLNKQYSVNQSHPNKAITEMDSTLAELKLTPNALLVLHVSQESDE